MVILFKLTTRSRPAKMLKAYNSVIHNITSPYAKFIISIDEDDHVTRNSAELEEIQLNEHTTVCVGHSKNKIDAINRDVPKKGWDILVNLSDDQLFIAVGFDQLIREYCGLDTFLHLPDGHVNELLPTMSIMGREYYNRFGYIYHPDYASLWSDNEALDVAIELGRHVYLNKVVFDHEHPAWGYGVADKQLIETQKYYRQDERTYKKRKVLGFPKFSIYS